MQSFAKQNIVKPKTLACYICGRQFGTRSLTLHLKSCKEKFKIQQEQKTDKSLKIKLPQQPEKLNVILSQIQNGTLDQQILQKYNQQARNIHKYKVLPSCKYCGRTFNQESLISHMKACPKKDSSSNFQQKSSYKMPDDMKKPRTLACCICGRQFGLTSLKIHYPQCKQKFRNQELKKPFKQRNPTPQFSKEDEYKINEKVDWTSQQINEFNQRASQNYRNKALVQCQNCKRKFLPESYQRHLKNCKFINGDNMSQSVNLRQKSQNSKDIYQQVLKKPKVLMCHICGREFGLTSLKIHKKSCVEKWNNEEKKRPKSQRRPIPELIFENNEVFDLDSALEWDLDKITRYNQMANEVYRGCALFPCPICGRKFFQQSLVRHLKYCQKNTEQKKLKQQADKNASSVDKKQVKNSDYLKNERNQQPKLNQNILVIKTSAKNEQKEIATKEDLNKDSSSKVQQNPNENKGQQQKQILGDRNFNATIKQVNQELQQTLNQKKLDKSSQIKKQFQKLQQRVIQKPQQNVDIDRVQCTNCGRKFVSDRITKHQSICKGQIKKILNSNNEKQVKQVKPPNQLDQKNQFIQKSKSKQPSFKQKQTKVKKEEQKMQDLTNQLAECSKCGKKFMPSKLEKHQAKCKDVAFRAKNKQKEELHKQQIQPQKEVNPIPSPKLQNHKEHNKSSIKPTSRIKLQKIPESNLHHNLVPLQTDTKNTQSVQEIPSNLIKCKFCNRKFGQDRIEKHQNVCLNKKQYEQKQIENLIQATKTNGFKNNKITGLNKNQPSKVKENKKFSSQQKYQQNQVKSDLIPCSKCGRKFDSQRVKIHENICKGQSSLKRKNDKNLLKIPQKQNENKKSTNQLHQISKTPEINKKNNFHIKMVSKQHQTKPDITSSQILRKHAIKQNLQITEQLMNQIWDTKETKLKPIEKIQTKTNLNQIKQKRSLLNANKTSLQGGFYKRTELQQKRYEKQETFDIDESQKLDRIPCKKCGRKFVTDRIAKHQEICKVSRVKEQQMNIKQRRTSIFQNKQPLKSAQKFYQSKQEITAQMQIPESQKIIKQFKQIKNMKINESFIDNQIQRQLNQLNSKRQKVSQIKNSGFNVNANANVNRARKTFGGGEKFYCRNDKTPKKVDATAQREGQKSPKPIIAKKWFK